MLSPGTELSPDSESQLSPDSASAQMFSNMSVRDLMVPASEAACCSVSTTVEVAIEKLRSSRCHCVVVLGEGATPVGIVSPSQLVVKFEPQMVLKDWLAQHSLHSTDHLLVDGKAPVQVAAKMVHEEGLHHLFVMDGGAWIGVLSAPNLAKAFLINNAITVHQKATDSLLPRVAVTAKHITRTPLVILQMLFIAGWYVVLVFANDRFGFMLLKAVGIALVVGTVHNLNAFFLWCRMQRTRARFEARVKGEALQEIEPRAMMFVSQSAMSILRFYLVPLTVSMYSMTAAQHSDAGEFRLLYPVTMSTIGGGGLYHLEILAIVLVGWAISSKAASALVATWCKNVQDEPAKPAAAKSSWIEFVDRHTGVGYQLLWSLFLFWNFVMASHMTKKQAANIPVAMILCTFVGLSLNLNGYVLWKANKAQLDKLKNELGEKVSDSSVETYVNGNVWTAFRFFLVPFCVSTFSIVSSRNDKFWYLFPADYVGPLPDMALCVIVLLTFLAVSQATRAICSRCQKQSS